MSKVFTKGGISFEFNSSVLTIKNLQNVSEGAQVLTEAEFLSEIQLNWRLVIDMDSTLSDSVDMAEFLSLQIPSYTVMGDVVINGDWFNPALLQGVNSKFGELHITEGVTIDNTVIGSWSGAVSVVLYSVLVDKGVVMNSTALSAILSYTTERCKEIDLANSLNGSVVVKSATTFVLVKNTGEFSGSLTLYKGCHVIIDGNCNLSNVVLGLRDEAYTVEVIPNKNNRYGFVELGGFTVSDCEYLSIEGKVQVPTFNVSQTKTLSQMSFFGIRVMNNFTGTLKTASMNGFLGIEDGCSVVVDTLTEQDVHYGVNPENIEAVTAKFLNPFNVPIVDRHILASAKNSDGSCYINAPANEVFLSSRRKPTMSASVVADISSMLADDMVYFVGSAPADGDSISLTLIESVLNRNVTVAVDDNSTWLATQSWYESAKAHGVLTNVIGRESLEMSYQQMCLSMRKFGLTGNIESNLLQGISDKPYNPYKVGSLYKNLISGTVTSCAMVDTFSKVGPSYSEGVSINSSILGEIEADTTKLFESSHMGRYLAIYSMETTMGKGLLIAHDSLDLFIEVDEDTINYVWNAFVPSINKETIKFVLMGAGVKTLYKNMFKGFSALTQIMFEDISVKFALSELRPFNFMDSCCDGCEQLQRVLPDLTSGGLTCFDSSYSLRGMYKRMDKYLESMLVGEVGDRAFADCRRLEMSVSGFSTIPTPFKRIGKESFKNLRRVNIGSATRGKVYLDFGESALEGVSRIDSLSDFMNYSEWGVGPSVIYRGDEVLFKETTVSSVSFGKRCAYQAGIVNISLDLRGGSTCFVSEEAFYGALRYLRFDVESLGTKGKVIFGDRAFAGCLMTIFHEGFSFKESEVYMGDSVFLGSAPVAYELYLPSGSQIGGSLTKGQSLLERLVLKGTVKGVSEYSVDEDIHVVSIQNGQGIEGISATKSVEDGMVKYTYTKDGNSYVFGSVYEGGTTKVDVSKRGQILPLVEMSGQFMGISKFDGYSSLRFNSWDSSVGSSELDNLNVFSDTLSRWFDIYNNGVVPSKDMKLYSGFSPLLVFSKENGVLISWNGMTRSAFRRLVEGGKLGVAIDPISVSDFNYLVEQSTIGFFVEGSDVFAGDSSKVRFEDSFFVAHDSSITFDGDVVVLPEGEVSVGSSFEEDAVVNEIASKRRYLDASVLRIGGYWTGNCELFVDAVAGVITIRVRQDHIDDDEFYMSDYIGEESEGVWSTSAPWYDDILAMGGQIKLELSEDILTSGKKFTIGALSFPQVELTNLDKNVLNVQGGLKVNSNAFVGSTFNDIELNKFEGSGFAGAAFANLTLRRPISVGSGAFQSAYADTLTVLTGGETQSVDANAFTDSVFGKVTITEEERLTNTVLLKGIFADEVEANLKDGQTGISNSEIGSLAVNVTPTGNTFGQGLFNDSIVDLVDVKFLGNQTSSGGGSWFDGTQVADNVSVFASNQKQMPLNWFTGLICAGEVSLTGVKTLYESVLEGVKASSVSLGQVESLKDKALYNLDVDQLKCDRPTDFVLVGTDVFTTMTPGTAVGFKTNPSFYNGSREAGYQWKGHYIVFKGMNPVLSIHYNGRQVSDIYIGVLKSE